MSNKYHTVFYTGVTSSLVHRIYQHKQKLIAGFTERYNITELLYYESSDDPFVAIAREKQIKDYRRAKKIALIESFNPSWEDLYEKISQG